MKVSVCVPTFNSGPYIESCLQSALDQTVNDLEIIVSDNASTDSTWEIVNSISDPRVRTFRGEQNRGMVYNFNFALEQATGEYIKLLCSDDLLHPDALRQQVQFLEAHRSFALVSGGRELVTACNELTRTQRWFAVPTAISSRDLKVLTLMFGNIVGEPSAVLFTRSAYLQAGGFREGFFNLVDLDLWLRLSTCGPCGYLPSTFCRVRQHPESMTNHFRASGVTQDVVLEMTCRLLEELNASSMLRRIGMGRITGSHLRHAVFGFRRGALAWPIKALSRTLRMDPGLAGLLLCLMVRGGIFGIDETTEGHWRFSTSSVLSLVARKSGSLLSEVSSPNCEVTKLPHISNEDREATREIITW